MILPAALAVALAAGAQSIPADTARFVDGEYASPLGWRHYKLFVPAGAEQRGGGALIVMLHGCLQGAVDFARASRFNDRAAEASALVLYPEQPASANPSRCWNWFDPSHQARDVGEPALIAGMTREVAAARNIDATRIFIGGLSAGGGMAILTAIAYPDLYAAVGAHSGVGWRSASDLASGLAAMQGGGPDPALLAQQAAREMGSRARMVPLVALHGTADPVVRVAATRRLVEQMAALDALLAGAGSRLRADTTRAEAGGYGYELVRYRAASGEIAIEAWLIDGLAHAISGGAPGERFADPRGPEAAREMLRFFLEHPRRH